MLVSTFVCVPEIGLVLVIWISTTCSFDSETIKALILPLTVTFYFKIEGDWVM